MHSFIYVTFSVVQNQSKTNLAKTLGSSLGSEMYPFLSLH